MKATLLTIALAVLAILGASAQAPANVQTTQGDTTGVTITWDAVADATGYEITIEGWDVAINKTVRTETTTETRLVDKGLPRPGVGRYTVKAVYADGTKSAESDAAIGYAVLETMRILGVSTRQPWNGKVDIDVEYKTMRSRFRELFRLENPPYPDSVSITARTADGELLPVRSLTKESPLDYGTYTVNRKTLQNGTALFSGSGQQRLVWDADADTAEVKAPNTIITITVADKGNIYAQTTVSDTADINTTRPYTIMIGENDTLMPIPWAARWADEASTSLNMQDGSDFKLVAYTKYATVIDTIHRETMLADEEGTFIWKPDYGVTVLQGLFSNRATHAKTTYQSMVMRSPEIPPTVEHIPGALKVTWTVAAGCTYYQIVRRTLKPDGTRGAWENRMGVSPSASSGAYPDIGVAPGTTYEYAVCPKYADPMKYIDPDAVQGEGTYITAKPVVWAMGRMPIGIVLDAQAVGQDSIHLTWTHVPDAYRYDVYRDNGDGQYQKIGDVPYTEGITFTDTNAESGIRYTYKVEALNWMDSTTETSNPVVAYSRLDKLTVKRIQPRFPWNGLVDVLVSYKSARDVQQDGTPHFQLVATSGKDTLAIKTLTLASATTLDPDDFTLPDDGTPQHLVWDARIDLGEKYFPKGLILTISCARVEPYPDKDTTTAFTEQPVAGGFVPFDTRSVPEVQLGNPTTIYADLGWVEGAKQLEVLVNDKSVFTTTDEKNNSFTIGKEQLNIWGINTLTLKSDNGIEQTAQIKYPDFVFTATQGNRDSIIVEWNSLEGIHTYSISRRAANTADAFAEVARVQDTTRWADSSAETIIGEFEYTIMPLLAHNEEAGPQPAAVTGYRALDIARSVTITSTENGTVTPDKITARYGETVTLTITPATGYELDQFHVMDGETEVPATITAESNYIFTMPANDIVVSATFKAINYTITTTPPLNGSLSADKATAHYGDIVTLTVTPATGYELDLLSVTTGETSVDVVISEGNYTFVMPAGDVAVSAMFKAIDYTVAIAPANNGTITSDKETAHYGDIVTLTITPAIGYEFDELRVLDGGTEVPATATTDGNYTFTMPANNVHVSVTFKVVNYTITTMPAQNGSITADKQTANYGDMVTLTITPVIGYELDELRVLDGGTEVPVTATAEGNYTFTMPAGDVVISATFKVSEYTIAIVHTAMGVITADKQTAHYGEIVTLTVAPNEGYEFDRLHVMHGETEIEVVVSEGKYTFIMPAGDITVSATFNAIEYSITLTLSGNGSVIADKAIVHYGETVTLTVTPAIGYELDQLRVTYGEMELALSPAEDNQYTFVMPAGNVAVFAVFKAVTGVENVTAADVTPSKILRNGQVLIIRGNKTYTLTGIEVK